MAFFALPDPRRLAGGVATLLLLAGCTVGPDFKRPGSPSAAAYLPGSEQAGSGAPAARIGEAPPLRWWTAFNSPEIDALVDRALANNHSLAASNATLARTRADLAAIKGTQLPQVDANARIEQTQVNLAAFGFGGPSAAAFGLAGNPEFGLYTVGGGISYDLDLFGGRRRRVEQSAAATEAQLRQTQAAHLTLAGQVVNQALTLAAVRTRIDTQKALIAEDERNVALTDQRRRGGEGTLVEVLNAQSQLVADQAELPQLDQQLAAARHMLAVLVGSSPAEAAIPDLSLDRLALPAEIPVTLPSELVHVRPDILQAEADLHAATAAVGIATAQLYPNITLGATITQGSPQTDSILKNAFRGYDIFAGLTAPIFHGGTLKAQREAAIAGARAADATYQQTVLEAFGQVADLLDALRNDAQSVADQRRALDVSSRSLHLSRRSFQVGNSGVLQVLDAERAYQRALSGVTEARARQYVNVARLFVATAGGWAPMPTVTARK
jgi:NodT family efflux transporter outer membrane factor (OMF) lipoprotein